MTSVHAWPATCPLYTQSCAVVSGLWRRPVLPTGRCCWELGQELPRPPPPLPVSARDGSHWRLPGWGSDWV